MSSTATGILVALLALCTAAFAADRPYYAPAGRALKVRAGHPILFVNADLVARLKTRPENLQALAHTVGKYRTNAAKDPNDLDAIHKALTQWNDRSHPGEYLQTSMWFALQSYLNDDPVATVFGREYLRAIVDLPLSKAQGQEAHALGTAFGGGVLYDYLYTALDDDLKHRTRVAVVEAGEALRGWNYLDPNFVIGGHGCCWAQPYLFVGLLGIHSDIGLEPAEVQARYYDLLGTVVTCLRASTAAREWICHDGGYQMGWDYGSCYTTMIPYLAWEFGTAEPSLFKDWQNQMTYWYLYGLRQEAQAIYADRPQLLRQANAIYPASGDMYGGSQMGGDPLEALLVGAWKYDNPTSKWTVNHMFPSFPDVSSWQMVLYRQFGPTDGTPPEKLPLSRCFRNAGSVVMRDSWDLNRATQVVFKSTPFFSNNHHHRDQNSFVIYYQGPLAIDSGGYGLCGQYGSRHWYNYFIRSVAHNTMLVYDPKEDFGESRHGKNSNDGGQAMWPFGNETGRVEEVMPGGRCALDGIQRFEERPEYTYTMGDATKAYAPMKVQLFQRHLVCLRNHSSGHPAVVVYDRVIAQDPAFRKTYLLHSIGQPVVDGRVFRVEAAEGVDPARKGRLYDEVLLPADATLTPVGGVANGREFLVADDGAGQPHNYREEFLQAFPKEALQEPADRERSDMRELGGWRMEVSPGAARADDTFLNVLSVTDAAELARPAQAKLEQKPTCDAVTVLDPAGAAGTLVVFWHDGAALADVSFALNGCRQALFIGLPPGRVLGHVVRDGRLVLKTAPNPPAPQKVTDQGTLYCAATAR